MTEDQRSAFREVARDQLPWLYSLALRLVGDRAEDVVQECLVKAFRRYDGLRDHQAAPAWFRQILLNCIRDLHRSDACSPRQASLDDVPEYSLYRRITDKEPWPYSDTVHLDFLRSFREEDFWDVLDCIEPPYRAPLVLVHMEGFSTRQVARMLAVPQGTVLSWLERGRKLFERELWNHAEEHGLLAAGKGARS